MKKHSLLVKVSSVLKQHLIRSNRQVLNFTKCFSPSKQDSPHKPALLACFLLLNLLFFSLEGSTRDLYETLGLTKTATPAEIKAAHRRLAVQFHPDKNPGDAEAEAKFKEMQSAYEILKDPVKRQRYDLNGSTDDMPQTTNNPQRDEEFARRYREELDKKRADFFGTRITNENWTYDPETRKLYDSRIKKWLSYKDGNFRTEEGWILSFTQGTYSSHELRAYWFPEDGKGWFRQTTDPENRFIFIDPMTGFSRGAAYAPNSTSSASQLFDELMNPVSLLNFKAGRGNRAELLKQFSKLEWTEAQISDFIERAKAHTTILSRPDMKVFSAGDQTYFDAAREAVLDYEIVRQHPEIVVDFLRRAKQNSYEFARTLVNPDWLNHPNSSVWLRELFQNPSYTRAFWIAALSGGNPSKGPEVAARFSKAYSILDKAGMNTSNLEILLEGFGLYGDTFKVQMDQLASTQTFRDLIATIDPEKSTSVRNFLNWYSKHEPEKAKIFEQALDMPGTKRKEFSRLTPDHREYIFAEAEYKAHKAFTSQARSQYLNEALQNSTVHDLLMRCEGFFRLN